MEIWKDILGFEGYYKISSLGRVKSLRSNIILKQGLSNGYYRVRLSVNNKQKTYKIHRLVSIHFIDNKEGKPQVNHIDGNKKNNCTQNLEWCTNSENRIHAGKIGLMPYGENNKNAKLTSKDVLEIRSKYIPRVYGCTKLAKEYNVHHSTILDVLKYKQWKHIN
jgi:hypothetical protein